MKNQHIQLICASTILTSTLLSILICFLFQKNIVSVDLVKILNAQAFYSNQFILKNPQSENWIHDMKEKNSAIREKIRLIAGKKTIVIVSPATLQGTKDITDRVLVSLGLPSKLPNLQYLKNPLPLHEKPFE